MKMLKKLSTLILGVALLCALVLTPEIKSRADGPVTWYLTYSGVTWYGSSNQMNYWTSDDVVRNNIKDGDNLVINGDNASSGFYEYTVDKKLNELAVAGAANANVTAPYVERTYVA